MSAGLFESSKPKPIPNISKYCDTLITKIEKVLETDTLRRDLDRIIDAVDLVETDEDLGRLKAVKLELGALVDRVEDLRERLSPKESVRTITNHGHEN